jgi:hypothetical protein
VPADHSVADAVTVRGAQVSTTTTEPETSTTSAPASTTTSAGATSTTTGGAVAGDDLARTGTEGRSSGAVAALLVLGGVALVATARRARRSV